MSKVYSSSFSRFALAAVLLIAFSATANAQYFEGKTIEIIVGFASGGTDTTARIVARRLSKYLPGNPSVVVKNMPGGASLKAQNFVFERAKPDGTTLSFNPFQVMAEITGREGVRFSYPKFTFVAGVKAPSFVAVARNDLAPGGLNKPSDIAKITKALNYTGRNPLHSIDVMSTLGFDLLGMKHNYVRGFRDSASITTSIEQAETHITGVGSATWNTQMRPRLIDTGKVKALFQFGVFQPDGSLTPDPAYPGVPLLDEFYVAAKGSKPSGPLAAAYDFAKRAQGTANFLALGPPNMNPEATKQLRAAYEKAMADPETIAEAKKALKAALRHINYDLAKKVMDSLRDADPKMVAFWKDRTARQAGAK